MSTSMSSRHELPATTRAAYREELRRAYGRTSPVAPGIVINGVAMAAMWWLLPTFLTSIIFDTHSTWTFPTVLASWLLSDTVATNVFGADRIRMSAALSDSAALKRLLYAKDLALWTIVVPPCLVVGVLIGIWSGPTFRTGVSALLIMTMPFAALGLATTVGAVLPYHPWALLDRWRQRRTLGWRNGRWLLAASIPYVAITPLAFLAVGPSMAFWVALDHSTISRPPFWAFLLGATLAIGLAAALWLGGNNITVRLAARRRDALRAYLADPALG